MASNPPPKRSKEEIRHENEAVLSAATPGDLLQFDRGAYYHWAVYIGEGRIIHLAGPEEDMGQGSLDKVKVREDDVWKVIKDSPTRVNNDKDARMEPMKRADIVRRARANLGQVGYNVAFFNCEHFCSWCRYSKIQSDQVDNFVENGAKMLGPTGIYINKAYNFLKSLSVGDVETQASDKT